MENQTELDHQPPPERSKEPGLIEIRKVLKEHPRLARKLAKVYESCQMSLQYPIAEWSRSGLYRWNDELKEFGPRPEGEGVVVEVPLESEVGKNSYLYKNRTDTSEKSVKLMGGRSGDLVSLLKIVPLLPRDGAIYLEGDSLSTPTELRVCKKFETYMRLTQYTRDYLSLRETVSKIDASEWDVLNGAVTKPPDLEGSRKFIADYQSQRREVCIRVMENYANEVLLPLLRQVRGIAKEFNQAKLLDLVSESRSGGQVGLRKNVTSVMGGDNERLRQLVRFGKDDTRILGDYLIAMASVPYLSSTEALRLIKESPTHSPGQLSRFMELNLLYLHGVTDEKDRNTLLNEYGTRPTVSKLSPLEIIKYYRQLVEELKGKQALANKFGEKVLEVQEHFLQLRKWYRPDAVKEEEVAVPLKTSKYEFGKINHLTTRLKPDPRSWDEIGPENQADLPLDFAYGQTETAILMQLMVAYWWQEQWFPFVNQGGAYQYMEIIKQCDGMEKVLMQGNGNFFDTIDSDMGKALVDTSLTPWQQWLLLLVHQWSNMKIDPGDESLGFLQDIEENEMPEYADTEQSIAKSRSGLVFGNENGGGPEGFSGGGDDTSSHGGLNPLSENGKGEVVETPTEEKTGKRGKEKRAGRDEEGEGEEETPTEEKTGKRGKEEAKDGGSTDGKPDERGKGDESEEEGMQKGEETKEKELNEEKGEEEEKKEEEEEEEKKNSLEESVLEKMGVEREEDITPEQFEYWNLRSKIPSRLRPLLAWMLYGNEGEVNTGDQEDYWEKPEAQLTISEAFYLFRLMVKRFPGLLSRAIRAGLAREEDEKDKEKE